MNNDLMCEHKSARTEWIDVCRGLLIVFMVLGHAGSPMMKWIYLFHMPAFLFLSGYTGKTNGSFLKSTTKRAKRLLLPYVIWNVCYIAFYSFLSDRGLFVFFESPFPLTIFDFVKNLSTTDLGGATWFLPVLFEISVAYHLLHILLKALHLPKATPYAGMLIGICGFWLCDNGYYLPYLMDLSLYGMLYYSIGQLFAKELVLQKKIPEKEMLILCVFVSFVFAVLYPNKIMNWPTRQFTGLMEDTVCAVCGIYICYRISNEICETQRIKKLFVFWGKYSIGILTSHFAVFRFIFAVFHLLGFVEISYLHNLTPKRAVPLEWVIVTFGTLALCSCAFLLIERIRRADIAARK